MLRAKTRLRAKQLDLMSTKDRIQHIAKEKERLQRLISETKDMTVERHEAAKRAEVMKRVGQQTEVWKHEELAQRRQAVSEQRQRTRAAIEARRMALLKARHEDFLTKKQESQLGRTAILAARERKEHQARVRTSFIREQAEHARQRNATRAHEREIRLQAFEAVQHATDQAEIQFQQSLIARLQREEERLLRSVVQAHAQHRAEFDSLHQTAAPFARGSPLPRRAGARRQGQ